LKAAEDQPFQMHS